MINLTGNLTDLLKAALDLGIIDIFDCISYMSKGADGDEILKDLIKRVEAKRARIAARHPWG